MEIPDSAFTVIIGPNACGKSTLLRALARMLKPTAGRGAAGRPGDLALPVQGGRPPARAAAAVLDRAGRHHGRRPGRPRPLPAPAAAAAVEPHRRAGRRARRWPRPGSPTWPTGRSTSCPAASGSGSGSRWRWPSRRRSCCWTSRPPTWTSPTRSRCSTCAPICTRAGPHPGRRAARPQPRVPATPPT